jgi:hypothetical protein
MPSRGPGIGILGVALGRPLQAVARLYDPRYRHMTIVVENPQNALVGAQALRSLAPHELHVRRRNGTVRLRDLDHDAPGDIALNSE